MTHANRRRQWQARVVDYHASELTMREWCLKNGFRVDQLRYWLRKSRKTGYIDNQSPLNQVQGWACVELIDEDANPAMMPTKTNRTATVGAQVTVRVGAAMIEVRSGFDSALLSDVLRVVVATC